ncbi:MAG: molybdate ABC transporter substrate-binding protein [Bacteroidales bacterium]|nr:molybdate ABC transporter substrate-binding protein [Bacteroidales bacterium]
MRKTILFTLFLSLFAVGCQQVKRPQLTIATAANMQFAMKAIVHQFSRETGVQCKVIISSSGKLTAQIKSGAPYDVFVSADMKYPETLYKAGFGFAPPKIYAYGKLVLWSLKKQGALSLQELSDQNIKHIALANPKTAPYGVAAEQVLKATGLFDAVKDKLVFGESIAQTNQFITSGTADIGFTAQSVVLAPEVKGKGSWIVIDPDLYKPIAQGILVLKHGEKHNNEAVKLVDFLFSKKGRTILEIYGYKVADR